MKKIKDLKHEDFPGIDGKKYIKWKSAKLSYNRRMMIVTILGIGIIITTLITRLYPGILILMGFNNAISSKRKALVLAEEDAGITQSMIREARKEEILSY